MIHGPRQQTTVHHEQIWKTQESLMHDIWHFWRQSANCDPSYTDTVPG